MGSDSGHIMDQMTLGVAGSAKNTGKTTTIKSLLESFGKRRKRIGLTSIGFDGENIDNISGLPKPRLYLEKGVFVAVSEKCISASSADIKIITAMDMVTPLGKLVCGQVNKAGLLIIAGPNQRQHLHTVKEWMFSIPSF